MQDMESQVVEANKRTTAAEDKVSESSTSLIDVLLVIVTSLAAW
jgi:hypothetical protein